MRAVDRFWGLPGSDRVGIAAGTPRADVVVTIADERIAPGGAELVLLPELRALTGAPLVEARDSAGAVIALAAQRDDGTVELAFDPDPAVARALLRGAYTARRPLAARLPFHYHRIPAPVRRVLRDLLGRRAARDAQLWPAWPRDLSVEALRRVYLLARQATDPGTGPAPFWPGGARYALCLTHDVDSEAGLSVATQIAADERERGLAACWYLLGAEYPLDDGRADALREAGGEIGLHDALHDNQIAFMEPDAIERRLDGCAPAIERLAMRGFRSPSMLRTERLYDALRDRFAYDSSVPDTGLLPRRNGCASVFPLELGGVAVLPLTVPPDGQLLARGMTPAAIVAAWISKCEWIRDLGGAAVWLAHPDEGFSAAPAMRDALRAFFDWTADQTDAWRALPREVIEHWRARSEDAVPQAS